MESASQASGDSFQAALAQQGARLDQHSSLLNSASHDFQLLSGRLTEIHNRLEQVAQAVGEREAHIPPAEILSSSGPEPQVINPPTYDGDIKSCKAFLDQCSLVFALQPRRFASEVSKVAYVLTLLTGRARDWGMAVWGAKDPCCVTFETLRSKMTKLFDRSVQGDLAAAALTRLTQDKSTVTDYAIEFRTLAVSSEWNDTAQKAQFLRGLNESIQDEIASHDLPTSLEGVIDLALRVEARHRQRRVRRSFHHLFSDPSLRVSDNISPSSSSVEPMQLGRLRLTAEEKQHRFTNGLCLYCGKPGHKALTCPAKGSARR